MKFKPIKNFENYEVSDTGYIRSLDRIQIKFVNGKRVTRRHTGRILKRCKQTKGYLFCRIYDETGPLDILIHRAVAEAFIKDYKPKYQIRFKNSNSNDCRAENLVVTKFEHHCG